MSPRRDFLVLVASAFCGTAAPPAVFAFQIILVKQSWKAEEILRRLRPGESFEGLAKKHSIDPSASWGGYVGSTGLLALGREATQAVAHVHSRQLTEVTKTPFGNLIVKVLGKESEGDTSGGTPKPYQTTDNVRYTTEVGGFFRAVQLFKRFQEFEDQQDLRANCRRRQQALATQIHYLENYLATPEVRQGLAASAKLMEAHEALGQFWSYQGKMEKAVEQFQAAYEIAGAHGLRSVQLDFEEQLGIAEMRRGETENCVHGHAAMSCIFPLCPEAQHKLPSGSEKAIQHFAKYLSQKPDDLEVKWLLNFACMTLGMYPHGIPEQYLIPSAAFESKQDIGHFVDIAPSLGLNVFHMAGGVIVDDFDNDGFLDVVISSFDSCAPLRYFHNNGDGTFTDRSSEAGFSDQLGGLNIVQTDYNNDGLLDIYVMRGAWELPIRNSLLRNNGDGTFTDVTHQAGLAAPAHQTLSAAWADFDNDGHLDLFVGHEFAASQLFRNNGDGTFTE
jgi:hypothetical protein